MSEIVLAAEPTIRLAVFLGVFAAMALWEAAAPPHAVGDRVILRLSSPILAVDLAVMAWDHA